MKAKRKPRVDVISPFLDKRHGTELCIAEQIERLADDFEIHAYSTRIADMDMEKFTWHRIPDVPGPHLVKYVWFFCANHAWRWFGNWFGRDRTQLTYSPGINCFDADLINVHIVFAEFRRIADSRLKFRANPARSWFRLVHRRMFYRLIIGLEHEIYRRSVPLIAVSAKVKGDLSRHYPRNEAAIVIHNGISCRQFNPVVRAALRDKARQELGFSLSDFVLLLIGNDWKKKGLECLFEALALADEPHLSLAVVGKDDVSPFRSALDRYHLDSRVRFLPVRKDPEFYYAAADAYVGPSLEDAFAIPPLEAMACGVPVIVSSRAGVSEVLTDAVDALILQDPEDASELARLIIRIYKDEELRYELSKHAAKTASRFTWQRNADQLRSVFHDLLAKQGRESVTAEGAV